jgi:hypothetical protein
VLVLAKGLSNEALRPISPDRVADLLGRDDAEPGRAGHLAGDGEHDETSAPRAKGRASLNAQEIGPSQEPIRTREGLVSRGHGGAAGRRSCEKSGARWPRSSRRATRRLDDLRGGQIADPEACFLKAIVGAITALLTTGGDDTTALGRHAGRNVGAEAAGLNGADRCAMASVPLSERKGVCHSSHARSTKLVARRLGPSPHRSV